MLDDTLIARLAAELQQSQTTRVQVEHFSKRFPGMTVEDGYAISREWVKLKQGSRSMPVEESFKRSTSAGSTSTAEA